MAHAQLAADPARLNAAMRAYWSADSMTDAQAVHREAVLGLTGVTQYRGYMMPVESHYPVASLPQVDSVMQLLRARTIVVAHSPVDSVYALQGGRVWVVDVNEPGAQSQVLRFDHGLPRVVMLDVERNVADAAPAVRTRALNPFAARDRALLTAMLAEFRRLKDLPHPY